MCGRYKVTPGEFSDLKLRFNLEEIPLFKPRYNIAPTQQAPVIANADGANRVELFQWGLVPSWAKDISIGNRMINARAETLAEKSRPKTHNDTLRVFGQPLLMSISLCFPVLLSFSI